MQFPLINKRSCSIYFDVKLGKMLTGHSLEKIYSPKSTEKEKYIYAQLSILLIKPYVLLKGEVHIYFL